MRRRILADTFSRVEAEIDPQDDEALAALCAERLASDEPEYEALVSTGDSLGVTSGRTTSPPPATAGANRRQVHGRYALNERAEH